MKPQNLLLLLMLTLLACHEQRGTDDVTASCSETSTAPVPPVSGTSQQIPSTPHATERAANVKWATPRGFDLTLDIYTPQTGRENYPVIIVYHGGGWLINDKRIMNEAAAYLAGHGEYVVCNVDYRLLGDLDNSVTMDEIVGDAFGALLWVREHIAAYGGDPERIIVTGDSAGGLLATMVATQGHRLSATADFGAPDYSFRPSYLPERGLPPDGVGVQAAIISYGAFDHLRSALSGFESSDNVFWQMGGAEARGIFGDAYNPRDHAERYRRVSPLYLVEPAEDRSYPPMLFTVGSEDDLTTPASIRRYVDKLKAAGHRGLEYWVYEGQPHAFLDSGINPVLGTEFGRDAVPALNKMLTYLNDLFYPVKALGPPADDVDPRSWMIRIAELEIHPEHLAAYQSILREEAAASVEHEPGVICIFPMYKREEPTSVRLVEIYADRAAYEQHLRSPHFLHYKTTTHEMVKSLELVDMESIDPASMGRIFRKLSE